MWTKKGYKEILEKIEKYLDKPPAKCMDELVDELYDSTRLVEEIEIICRGVLGYNDDIVVNHFSPKEGA